MDYYIVQIEQERKLAQMRKQLLSRYCSVDTINRAYEIKKQLKGEKHDKRD